MAFYQNMPEKKTGKTNYANRGEWEEEGSRYSGRTSERGDRRKPDSRGTYGHSAGTGKSSFGDRAKRNGPGEHRRGTDQRRDSAASRYGRTTGDRFAPEGRRPREDRSFNSRPAGNGRSFGDGMNIRRTAQNERRTPRDAESFEERRFDPETRERAVTFHDEAEERDYRDYEYQPPMDRTRPMAAESDESFILGGRNPIREAIRSGRDIEKLLVQKGELSGSAREIVQMAREARIPVQVVEKTRLDELAAHHQGLLAFASAFNYSTVDQMLANAEERGEKPFLILLDGITDPHNLGAVIRTAECVGAHGVIVPERRSVGLTPAAVKASAGAVEHMPVARVTNLNRTIEQLKEKGLWVYGVTMEGADFESVDFHDGTALVIGAEGEGISRLTLESCDQKVSVPMKGHLDSLNASVAAGVVMYRVLCSRRK